MATLLFKGGSFLQRSGSYLRNFSKVERLIKSMKSVNNGEVGATSFSRSGIAYDPYSYKTFSSNEARKRPIRIDTKVYDALLVESQRENLVLYSRSMGVSGWGESNGNFTPNQRSFDRSSKACLIENTGGLYNLNLNQNGPTLSTSTKYTSSIFIKNVNSLRSRLLFTSSGSGNILNFILNWSGQTLSSVSTSSDYTDLTVHHTELQEVRDGWYRVWITYTTDSSDVTDRFQVAAAYQIGNAGSESILVDGAQTELGDHPSSIIETEASPVTRGADLFYTDLTNLTNSKVNGNEGSYFCVFIPYMHEGSDRSETFNLIRAGAAANGYNRFLINQQVANTDNFQVKIRDATNTERAIQNAQMISTSMQISTACVTYSSSGLKFYTNGTLKQQDLTDYTPYDNDSDYVRMNLGQNGFGSDLCDGWILVFYHEAELTAQEVSDLDNAFIKS